MFASHRLNRWLTRCTVLVSVGVLVVGCAGGGSPIQEGGRGDDNNEQSDVTPSGSPADTSPPAADASPFTGRDDSTGGDDSTRGDDASTVGETGPSSLDTSNAGDASDGSSLPSTDSNVGGPCSTGETRPCGLDEGVCEKGVQTCTNGTWGPCKGGTGAKQEVCNGKDDDCDGTVDNGVTRPCGKSKGQCQEGKEICSNGTWGSCQNQTKPTSETCNGLDDDCDGKIDETLKRQCGGGGGTGACSKKFETCNNGQWGNCKQQTQPQPEKCDKVDNDCDGSTDEGLTQTCGKSKGQCRTGREECTNGTWSRCQNNVGPTNETCNGTDDDCDGNVDENLQRSCGKSTGRCKQGTETCNSGSWSSCQGSRDATNETCNGLDDDCDGATDEGIGGTRTNCGKGVCRSTGRKRCQNGNLTDTCSPGSPSSEVCDGQDNDCDGSIDEGLRKRCGQSTGRCTRGYKTCSNGTFTSCRNNREPTSEACNGLDDDCDGRTDENLTRNCGQSTGQCQQGTEQCSGGSWSSCQGEIEPDQEICNGSDDDCDGDIDENLTRGSCGQSQGQCREGTEVCDFGQWTCSGNEGPDNETCNGKDDDCDGSIDEGVGKTYYIDRDGDDYGASGLNTKQKTKTACSKPSGYVDNAEDCDDGTDNIHPMNDPVKGQGCYDDDDDDGYGDDSIYITGVDEGSDCDDFAKKVNPGQTSYIVGDENGGDYDCDGTTTKKWDKAGGQCECKPVPIRNQAYCGPAGGRSDSYLPAWGDNDNSPGVPDCGEKEIWIKDCGGVGDSCSSQSDSCNAGNKYEFRRQKCR